MCVPYAYLVEKIYVYVEFYSFRADNNVCSNIGASCFLYILKENNVSMILFLYESIWIDR